MRVAAWVGLMALAGCPSPRSATATPARRDPAESVREAYRMKKESSPERRFSLEEASHRDRLLSRRFAALWELDERWSRVTRQVPNFNLDPLLFAQDYPGDVLGDLVVDIVERRGDRAEVRARFTVYSAPRDIRFDVLLEQGRWVIDDIRSEGQSAAQILAVHPCAEGWTGPCRK